MMNPRGWRLVGAIIGVAGLALAGCGGGDDGGGGSASDPDSHGPLAEFYGWDEINERGEQEFTEEDRQRHYEVQALVEECMADQGFEYTPEQFWGDRDDYVEHADPHQEIWELQQDDPEAFAKEYGYGITTIDYDDVEENEDWDPAEQDPNHEYRESLSEAALQEYEKALWGDITEIEGEAGDGEVPEDYEPSGCHAEATGEVYGTGDDPEGEDQFEELWEEWDALHERTQNDARVTEVRQAWSSCMADAGYPGLEEIFDAQDQVYQRQNELYGYDEPGAEPGTGEGDVVEEAPPSPGTGVENEPDPEELAAVREFELAIALADYECKQEHDVEQIEREVQFEHEEQFLEDHREQHEAYREWLDEQDRLG